MEEVLSDLFRKIEADLGTHEFCILVLDALKNALSQNKIKTKEKLFEQVMELLKMIKATKPRYAILVTSFYRFFEFYEKEKDTRTVKELIEEIERIKVSYRLEAKQMVEAAQKIDVAKKTILVYTHSQSVQRVLQAFRASHTPFEAVVVEQDMEKTEDNIEFCHREGIPYKVVPSYMLSHVDHSIDMVFAGAVTFQEDDQFVMDPGSKSVISHFFLEKKPVYVFLSTSKLTLWPIAGNQPTIHTTQHRKKHRTLEAIEFERLKFSHDRVPLSLVSHIVTEKGIYTPQEFKKEFNILFEHRKKERKHFHISL